jgi:hypothetical protein
MWEEFFRFNKPWKGVRIVMDFYKEDSLLSIVLRFRKVHKKDSAK